MTDPSLGRKKRKMTIIASPQGVERAEKALIRLGVESKFNFAKTRFLSRSVITKFFQRQPIQLDSFKKICEELELNWREIAGITEEEQLERLKIKDCSSSDTNEEVEAVQTLRRQVTVIDKQSKEIKAVIILEGDITSVNNDLLITLELFLRTYSGDTIKITDIKEGSIRIIVEGSQEDIERLISQFELRELTEVSGYPVENIQILSESSDDDENNEPDDKWRLVQEIVTQGAKGRNLSGADLSDADLSGVNLSGADLSDADLSGADLSGADLSGADLSGADLSGADLSGAIIDSKTKLDDIGIPVEDIELVAGETLDDNENTENDKSRPAQDDAVQKSESQTQILRGNPIGVKFILANLIRGNLVGAFRILKNLIRADLRGANLSNADLSISNADLSCADLRGANLSNADLSNANLCRANLCRANLCRANLWSANLWSANLWSANLWSANLWSANLWSANLCRANLCRANLWSAYLSNADLRGANLRGANLWSANLRGANLRGANLSGAYLSNADLSNADLRGTDLSGAYLSRPNLSRPNLSRPNLNGANLSNADLRGANLSNADLSNADLSNADLRGAIVENALFGGSVGLTEDIKRDLKQRGAIFGDRPPVPTST